LQVLAFYFSFQRVHLYKHEHPSSHKSLEDKVENLFGTTSYKKIQSLIQNINGTNLWYEITKW